MQAILSEGYSLREPVSDCPCSQLGFGLTQPVGPIDFLGPLQRLPDHLLALQRDNIGDLIERYRMNGVGSSDPEQYNIVAQSLQGIWSRKHIAPKRNTCSLESG